MMYSRVSPSTAVESTSLSLRSYLSTKSYRMTKISSSVHSLVTSSSAVPSGCGYLQIYRHSCSTRYLYTYLMYRYISTYFR
jgi:hypothetical protein